MLTVAQTLQPFKSHLYPSYHLKIGNSEFVTSGPHCYVTHLEDYTVLSNFDITEFVEDDSQASRPNANNDKSGRKRCRTTTTTAVPLLSIGDIVSGDGDVDSIRSRNNNIFKSVPRCLKLKKDSCWIHAVHIQTFSRPIITRERLRERVCGDQILAYHYKECSIEGNRCIYYGFVPTMNFRQLQQDDDDVIDSSTTVVDATFSSGIDDGTTVDVTTDDRPFKKVTNKFHYGTHVTSKINVQHVWPRKLYVQLKRIGACSCSQDCVRVSVLTLDDVQHVSSDPKISLKPKNVYCLRRIPWHDVYVIMGDLRRDVVEGRREHRMCKTCAQCRKCMNSPVFCRDHKRCKHVKDQVDYSSFNTFLGVPKIKRCRKIV